jgi:hypothetical protein
MRKCTAATKQRRACAIPVEDWRTADLCHVHDPNGKFRLQMSRKGRQHHVYTKECKHTWYMREVGIICTRCSLVWEPSMG